MFGYILRRVLAAVAVALVLMLLHGAARAAQGVYSADEYYISTGLSAGCYQPAQGGDHWLKGSSAADVCEKWVNATIASRSCFGANVASMGLSGTTCVGYQPSGYGGNNVPVLHDCLGGATLVNGVCTGGTQEATCAASAGGDASVAGWYNFGSNAAGASWNGCESSCGTVYSGGALVPMVISGKVLYYGFGKWVWTGHACSGNQPVPQGDGSTPPIQSCGANQDGGYFNGKWICVDRTSGKTVDPNDVNGDGFPDSCEPGTVTNSDGTTTAITWTAATNTCSTVTKDSGGNTTDTCAGIGPDACKTTCGGAGLTTVGAGCDEQINGSSGGSGNTPTPAQCAANPTDPACSGSGDSWCKDHPDAMMCQTNTISASCSGAGASVTCNGDPVMCQMAREQATRDCQLFDQTTTQSQLGTAVAAGQDPMAGTLPSASNPSNVTLGASSIDQTEIFSGGCIAPWSFTVVGKTVNIDTTTFCDWAGKFGIVAQMAALVAAAFIIGGAL